jgi:hypothetical protein
VHALAMHLAEPDTSVMILVDRGGRNRHWTVVKKVTETSLILFGADDMSRASLASGTRDRSRLRARDVYLLGCEPR